MTVSWSCVILSDTQAACGGLQENFTVEHPDKNKVREQGKNKSDYMQAFREEVLEAHRWLGPLGRVWNREESREQVCTVISILEGCSSPLTPNFVFVPCLQWDTVKLRDQQ